jgi:hypothetical protein
MKNIHVDRAARRLERRFFLKALGIGLAAPLAYKLSQVAVAQPGARPKRFMLFFMPHGAPPEHYNPKVVSPTDFTLANSGVSVLGPLEDYKNYVNVLQGFNYPGGTTHEGLLTCLSNAGFKGVDESTPRTTVEHVIANGLGVTPLVLGAVPHRQWGLDKDGKLMWDGQPVVPEKNPLKAADSVFGNLGGQGSGPDPSVELNEALHSLTEAEVASLHNELKHLTAEESKLQAHLEAVRALKGGSGGAFVSCSTKPTIAAVESLRGSAEGQSDDFFLKEENFPQILAAQLELAAHALVCNATQVTAVQALYTNADVDFKFMGSPGGHHLGLSHARIQATGSAVDMTAREPFAKAQRWFMQQLADHVLTLLDQDDPADPGNKVIDNTVIYLMSEIGEGANHTSESVIVWAGTPDGGPMSYLPLVTIGGGGGALKTGQVVTFAQDRPAGDIYLSLCKAMGVQVSSFGDATNPVTEILA